MHYGVAPRDVKCGKFVINNTHIDSSGPDISSGVFDFVKSFKLQNVCDLYIVCTVDSLCMW